MQKRLTILSGLLVLQIAVAVGLNIGRSDHGTFEATEKLLSFDAKTIDSIRIDGQDDTHVVLKKQDGQWQLPALHDFPADQGSVTRFLEQLAGLDKGWPVATTASASKRFKVGEKSYERMLTLLQGDTPQSTLYVGTSPGFRKVHVRVPGEDAIHAVTFSAFEASTKSEDWINKALLTHKAEELQRVELPGFTLQRHDNTLVVAGLTENEETIEDQTKRLLENIAGLNIRSVLGTEAKPEYRQDEPALRYTLALTSGAPQTYVFSKPKEAEHYVLKASERPEYFAVDTWTVDRIKDVTRDTLVRKKPQDPAKATEPTQNVKEAPRTSGR